MQYLSPKILLSAYKRGLFPMAEKREDTDLFWVDPQFRGVLPINDFHISRSLRRRILKKNYEVTISTAFDEVVAACAERQETWINKTIFDLYCALAKEKHAHSIEIWQDRHLVGGVYGVVIGAAFFWGKHVFSTHRCIKNSASILGPQIAQHWLQVIRHSIYHATFGFTGCHRIATQYLFKILE